MRSDSPIQLLLFPLCVALAVGCSPAVQPATQNRFDYEGRIGLAHLQGDGVGCLVVNSSTLEPGTPAALADLTAGTPRIGKSVVGARASDPCSERLTLGGWDGGPPSFYRLQRLEDESSNSVAVAILDPQRTLAASNESIETDLDGDGANESFRACTSAEGLHFTVWTEPGRLVWHRYFYVGYDMEPTCSEEVYAGIQARSSEAPPSP